jgi:heptaprenyl diphosphate synthase
VVASGTAPLSYQWRRNGVPITGATEASGLGPDDLDRLWTGGREFGMAFQLVDDLLDLLGTEEVVGKPVGADIPEGVYTLPVILELRTNAKLRALLGSPPSPAAAEQARRLVVAGTGPVAAEERARGHVDRALAALDGGGLHPAVRQAAARLGNAVLDQLEAVRGPGVAAP